MTILYIISAVLVIILITYFGLWEIAIDIILMLCGGESSGSGGSGFDGNGKSGGGGADSDF